MTPAPPGNPLSRALRRVALASAAAALEGRSPAWPALERRVVAEEKRCRVCGATAGLEVHHVRPFHLYPELEMKRENCMCLCRRCHFLVGHGGRDWAEWVPTAPADAARLVAGLAARRTTREDA